MKLKPELLQLIESKAAVHGLDPDLVEAHILTESSGKPDATRFEQGFHDQYVAPLGLTDNTEIWGRSTSWGLMQIMGQVARELGYQGSFPGLLEPSINLEYGCKKLARCYKKYPGDAGIAAYNSGTPRKKGDEFINQVYVDRVKGFLAMIRADK